MPGYVFQKLKTDFENRVSHRVKFRPAQVYTVRQYRMHRKRLKTNMTVYGKFRKKKKNYTLSGGDVNCIIYTYSEITTCLLRRGFCRKTKREGGGGAGDGRAVCVLEAVIRANDVINIGLTLREGFANTSDLTAPPGAGQTGALS